MQRKHNLQFGLRFAAGMVAMLACATFATQVRADSVSIRGTINQSVQDGTGPAVNNPVLNQITDGDSFTVNLNFAGAISSPGTFTVSGVDFVTAGGATENNFSSAILTIVQSGGFDTFSLLACLATGSGCDQGNELDLNFTIDAANLNSQNAGAQGAPGLLPLELLEDDGVTDIHGSVTSFSNSSPAAVPAPEPSVFAMVGLGMIAAAVAAAAGQFKITTQQ